MSAHIRNLKLKSLKIHCFRSVSQVVSNEKHDDTGSTHLLNHHKDYCVKRTDIRGSRIYSDIIWHVRNANSNSSQGWKQNILYFRPMATSVEDLPLLFPGGRSKKNREQKFENCDLAKTTSLCDGQNNVVLGYQIRKDLDFIIHRLRNSDSLRLSDSRKQQDYTCSGINTTAGHTVAGCSSGIDSKCETVKHTEGVKPNSIICSQHNKFVSDDMLHETDNRTEICHLNREEESSSTVQKPNMNYSVTDPSDWTLYYCFQGDGKGEESKKEPVDRRQFPKGKPSMSTLDVSRDCIETEVTDFLNPGAINYKTMYFLHYNDVIFVNNFWGKMKTTRGFYQYICQLAIYRTAIKLRYRRQQMEVQSIHMDYDKGSIKIHWRAYCQGYFFVNNLRKLVPLRMKSKSDDTVWIEGISTFYCGEDGRIYKHYLDTMLPEEKNYGMVKTMKQKVAIALGVLPKPLAESRQNNYS